MDLRHRTHPSTVSLSNSVAPLATHQRSKSYRCHEREFDATPMLALNSMNFLMLSAKALS